MSFTKIVEEHSRLESLLDMVAAIMAAETRPVIKTGQGANYRTCGQNLRRCKAEQGNDVQYRGNSSYTAAKPAADHLRDRVGHSLTNLWRK